MNHARGKRAWRGMNRVAIAKASAAWPVGVKAKGVLRERGMNRLEAAYAAELERRRQAREIAWYAFEALKLRLADNTFYTPDFVVMGVGGELEIHETKGFWEEDARVKIKVAAAHEAHLAGRGISGAVIQKVMRHGTLAQTEEYLHVHARDLWQQLEAKGIRPASQGATAGPQVAPRTAARAEVAP